MNSSTKILKIQRDRDYIKLKKKVLKVFPGAHIRKMSNGNYEVCNSNGFPIRNPELHLPENKTVKEAWERVGYAIWYNSMISKSFRAFSDEKMIKKFAKQEEDGSDYEKD